MVAQNGWNFRRLPKKVNHFSSARMHRMLLHSSFVGVGFEKIADQFHEHRLSYPFQKEESFQQVSGADFRLYIM